MNRTGVTRHGYGLLLATCAAFAVAAPANADEGMWTFDNAPLAKINQAYNLKLDRPWLDRLQAAAIRLSNGCSASIVSPEGLVLTNHHCISDCAQDLSTPQTDFVKNGFLTQARSEERTCPGVQAETLTSITDVTAKIRAATSAASGDAFVKARDAAIAAVETDACAGAKEARCDVVSLYRGGQYKLYRYRRYDDVRLVFAPEIGIAFFGGDPDNFNFPRFNLDMAFLRLYEGGKPVRTPAHLKWAVRAPVAGEPVFVAGNPGGTSRSLTVAQLATERDLSIPISQLQRSELRGRLIRFSEESDEHRRIATDPLHSVENSYKVFFGRQFALNDQGFMARKQAAESDLRAQLAANPQLAARLGDPWREIAGAQAAYAETYPRFRQLEAAAGSLSQLYSYARDLVRAAAEREKPAAERLPEYGEARFALLEKRLLDARPIDAPLETLYLAFWLSKSRELLTADDPGVQALLGRESPEALAERLVSGSRLADPAVRKALWAGGSAAIAASDDPMIAFVRRTDAQARAVRNTWEEKVSGPTARAAERIAEARFVIEGDSVYPDATFTLRLSYGKVAGWSHRGRDIAPVTTFAGLYDRATGADPFVLPPRWLAAQGKLTPTTAYNFTTTNDIIGGNSGSPVVAANGEVLGAAFDGNIHSLGGDYGYDGALNRTVVVSTAAATEALTKVYGQTALATELTGSPRGAR